MYEQQHQRELVWMITVSNRLQRILGGASNKKKQILK